MGIDIFRDVPVPRDFADSAEGSYERLRLRLAEQANARQAATASVREEALAVLVALGLKRKEAIAKLTRVVVTQTMSVQQIVALALRA